MKSNYLNEDFLLSTGLAKKLFHEHAANLPIIDYHCHLPVEDIASDKQFSNITRVWLNGDHYKWRAMRANGVPEELITGAADDYDKFLAWAKTVPDTLRNPLFHWTHMELRRPFGVTGILLDESTAKEIWEHCNSLLNQPGFSARGLIKQFNVDTLCTTDDPIDGLEHHKQIRESGFPVNVLPAFRPDKGMMIDNPDVFYPWLNKLGKAAGIEISSFNLFIEAIDKRHKFFHDNGCRLSDHGIETAYAEDYTIEEINAIFKKVLTKKELSMLEILKFKSAMMFEFGVMDHSRGWVQQLHLGALRNTNSRMYRLLGPDTGYDSIGDFEVARPLAKFLNRLDDLDKLPKTIIYNLNPADNEIFATMIGNFQGGGVRGKLQYGSAWWFLDQMNGMEKQMNALSNMGLLSRFIGMLTDSRSFLSYPRHEYFRRLLCRIIGEDVKQGLLPDEPELLIPLVENISYYNAKNYFAF